MLSCCSRCSSMSPGTVRENAVSSSCILVPEGPAACGGTETRQEVRARADPPTGPGKAPGPDADRQAGHCPRPGASPPARLSLRPHGQGLTPSLASRSRWACGFQLAGSPRSAHPAPPLSAPALVRTLGAGREGPVLATHSLRQVPLMGCAR